jgi:hypothetical protein
MRTPSTSLALVATLALAACGGQSSTGPSSTPVVVDGVESPGEWDDATQVPAFSGATFFYKSDGVRLYLALSVQDATLDANDVVDIRFDNDRNGRRDATEDELALSGDGTFYDDHVLADSWGNLDQEQDGSGAVGASGGTNFFEMTHPLESGDSNDVSVASGDRIGYCLYVFIDGTASDATSLPSGCPEAGDDLSGYLEIDIK